MYALLTIGINCPVSDVSHAIVTQPVPLVQAVMISVVSVLVKKE